VARIIRLFVSLALILGGITLLAWGSIPGSRQRLVQVITPAEMQVPSGEQNLKEAILESRQVVVAWPDSMRIGDQEVISLVFEPVQDVSSDGYAEQGLSDVYASYALMAESRYEVAGMHADPPNPVRESMPAGQSVKFIWKINTREAGRSPGKIWLSLRFLPLDRSEASEVPIFVREVDIRANSLLGMSGPAARLWGSVGIISGIALNYDVMIGTIKKLISKARTKTVPVNAKEK
jgi:hypothetical protein